MKSAKDHTSPRFRGVIPPLVTPLSGRDALNVAGLHRLIEHVIAGGVSGIFILGTTGEAPSLSHRLRCQLIEQACDIVAGRVPLLVGITDTAFVESVHLARTAVEAGAAAVVLSTPYYFPAGQAELIGYIEHITQEIPLPLLLYNIPRLTKVWFEIETLKQLSSIESIVGIKDSSGDLAYFERLLNLRSERPDWSILMGPDHLLVDALRRGGDGGVAGGANLFPGLFVECCEAIRRGDEPRVLWLRERIDGFQQIYGIGKYASRYIKATKCALSLMGICDDFMAEPFHCFKSAERLKVQKMLDHYF